MLGLAFCLPVWLAGQTAQLLVPIGHTEKIASVAISADNRYILTGSYDSNAKLWEVDSGKEVKTFTSPTGSISSVAFSPDGRSVLLGSLGWVANLFDLQTGEESQRYDVDQETEVLALAYSPQGRFLALGCDNKVIHLWNLKTKKKLVLAGHTGAVTSVAFSADERYLLTGSADQTAIVWDLQKTTSQQIQTLRAHTASVNAVAIAPDGRTLLTGCEDGQAMLWTLGRDTPLGNLGEGHYGAVNTVVFAKDGLSCFTGSDDAQIKQWDVSTRQETNLLWLHNWPVTSLAVSADGRYLVSGSSDKTALMWNITSGLPVQGFRGHSTVAANAVFGAEDKEILTVTLAGSIRRWDTQSLQVANSQFRDDINGFTKITFSPDRLIALAGTYANGGMIWMAATGRPLRNLPPVNMPITSVAFSPNNIDLLLGEASGKTTRWIPGPDNPPVELPGPASTVTNLVFSPPKGELAFGSYGNGTGRVWSMADNQQRYSLSGMDSVSSAAFSPDGRYLLTSGKSGGLIYWDAQTGDKKATISAHEDRLSAMDISSDSQLAITGSWDGTAKIWNIATRKELHHLKGHGTIINSVAFSNSGKYAITASRDNTNKLWEVASGKELATLIALDTTDWVIIAPSGQFDASPGAMDLMYYLVGGEVVDLDQLKERYYEPGLLAKLLNNLNEPLREVDQLTKLELFPLLDAKIDQNKNTIQVQLEKRSGGMGKLSLFVNGKEVEEDVNPQRKTQLNIDLSQYNRFFLADRENQLSLLVYDSENWLKSPLFNLTYQAPAATPRGTSTPTPTKPVTTPVPTNPVPDNPIPILTGKPSLYAIVVGTSNYTGTQLDLRFADQDARAMATSLQVAGEGLFGKKNVQISLFITDTSGQAISPSRQNIEAAFNKVRSLAKPEDILVVYFSGHGVNYGAGDQGQFYYLTRDISSDDISDEQVRKTRTISSTELTEWIKQIPAMKQVFILDACNSGKVVVDLASGSKDLSASQVRALDRMKDRTGMFVLAGSAADKVSYEATQYGQGLLTYSLLEGMSGLGLTDDKRVDVMTLFQRSRDRVPELAQGIGGIQTPMLAFPKQGGSFDIGIVNNGAQIPLPRVKPVFIRNVLEDEENFGDPLDLTKELDKYLRTVTVKGAQAPIIYVDVPEYPTGYSIRGRYTQAGESLTVEGRLFQEKKSLGKFKVSGTKSNLSGLVEELVDKVVGLIQ